MESSLSILVVGAHPADIFDQSGGTMLRHAQRGDHVACVSLTPGARIHDQVMCDEMFHRDKVPTGEEFDRLIKERAAVKEGEVRTALNILKVDDVEVWDVDDAVLLVEPELVKRLARVIRKKKPDVIITHFPFEDGGVHSPHAECGRIVMRAQELATQPGGEDPNPPHKIAQVFFFGNGAAAVRSHAFTGAGGYYNDVFIDITDVIDTKLTARDQLVSQGYAGDYVRKRMETSDGAFGDYAGVGYAEGFISWRANSEYFLPVGEINLEIAKLSDHQALARRSVRHDFDASVAPKG